MRIVNLLITNGDIDITNNSFNIKLLNEIYFNNSETRCWLNNVKYINTVENNIKWNHYFLLKLDQINHNTIGNKINYYDEEEIGADITYYVKVVDGHYVYSKNNINGSYLQLEYLYLDSSRNSYIFDQRDPSNTNKKLVFGTNMASTTNFGHELSHIIDDYTFSLGSGDPSAVVITRVSDGSYKSILSTTGVQIPSSGDPQTNPADIGENYILLDFTIPYQHLDGGQVLFLGLTNSTSSSGSSSDHDSRYDIDVALSVTTNTLSPRINRGTSSGGLTSVFRYTGFLYKQQLSSSSSILVDSLRINQGKYFQYYNYYFNNVTAVGETFLDKANDLGYCGYPQLIKYPFLTKTTLDGAITTSSTTLILTDETNFPTRGYLLLNDSNPEVVYFTRNSGSNVCTIFKTTDATWTIGTAGPQYAHSDDINIFNRTLRKLVAHRPITGNSVSSNYYIKKQLISGSSAIGTFNAYDFTGETDDSVRTLHVAIQDIDFIFVIFFDGNINISDVKIAQQYISTFLSTQGYPITVDITGDNNLVLLNSLSSSPINFVNISAQYPSSDATLGIFGLSGSDFGISGLVLGQSGDHDSAGNSNSGEIVIGTGNTDLNTNYFEILQGRDKINRISESTSVTTYAGSVQPDTTEIIWFPSNIFERINPAATSTTYTEAQQKILQKIDFITPDANGILDISDYYVYPGLKWTRPVSSGNTGSGAIGMYLESSRWSDGTLSGDFMIKVMQYDFAKTGTDNDGFPYPDDNKPDMLFFYEGILTFSLKKFYNQNKIAKHNTVQGNINDNSTKHDTNIPTDITNNYEIVNDEYVNVDDNLIGASGSRKFVRFFLSTQQSSADNENQPVVSNLHFSSYPLTTITHDAASFTQTANGTAGSGSETDNVTLTNLHLSNQDIVFAYSENNDVDHDEIHVINEDVLNNTDTTGFSIIKNTGNSALVNKEYYIGKINNQRIRNFSGILETNGLNNIFSNSNGKILIELMFN